MGINGQLGQGADVDPELRFRIQAGRHPGIQGMDPLNHQNIPGLHGHRSVMIFPLSQHKVVGGKPDTVAGQERRDPS